MKDLPIATAKPGRALLDGPDHALVLIDYQSQMAFATRSIDVVELRNNAALIAKAAAEFKVPTVLTSVAARTFSGPMFDEVTAPFPGQAVIDRTTMNTWEDGNVIREINRIARRRLVFAGMWTSVCIVGPVMSSIDQGFEAFVITDACGDVTDEAHGRAVQRMIQAGARPMTALQYLLELQRDWARVATYNATVATAITHGGGYGLGLIYARTMFDGGEGH